MGVHAPLAVLDRRAGDQFDPQVVTAFRPVVGDDSVAAAPALVLPPACLVDPQPLLAAPGEAS